MSTVIILVLILISILFYFYPLGTFIGLIIYAASFCMIGNTCYRTGPDGLKHLNILPLFTEGFVYPLRTIALSVDLPFKDFIQVNSKLLLTPYNPYLTLFLSILLTSFLIN